MNNRYELSITFVSLLFIALIFLHFPKYVADSCREILAIIATYQILRKFLHMYLFYIIRYIQAS